MNKNIEKFLNQRKAVSFQELLFSFIDRSGEKDSDVYNRAGIDRRVFSKLRCNENYILCRENIIKLCFSLKLDLRESTELLGSAGYGLGETNKADNILRFCLSNSIYDLSTVNDYLYDYANVVLD